MNAPGLLDDAGAAAAALAGGAVVLMPTDTVVGLHARVDHLPALALIAELKGRDAGRPLVVLAGSRAQAALVAMPVSSRQEALLARCWPGPFSMLLPARPDLAAAVTGGTGRVAVRVPGLAWLRELVLAAGAPLASTSANLSGESAAPDFAAALARFGARVRAYAGPADTAATRSPAAAVASAVVDLATWPPRVLREGPRPLPALPPDA